MKKVLLVLLLLSSSVFAGNCESEVYEKADRELARKIAEVSTKTRHLTKEGRLKLMVMAIFLFIAMLGNQVCYAEDSLSAVMQRMKTDSAVKIVYQETRTLELMDQPWLGSGYMYSMAPDLMIREQLQPQRLLMGVKGNKMYYFDPEHGVRHQGEMDIANPLTLNIAVFKALINADEVLLRRLFQIEFSTKSQRWVMILKPRLDSGSGFSITVSGLPGQQADTIISKQADGDLSEFMLQKNVTGAAVNSTVMQLYHELSGE